MSDVKSRAIKALRDKSAVSVKALHIKLGDQDSWHVLFDPAGPNVGISLTSVQPGTLRITMQRTVHVGLVTVTYKGRTLHYDNFTFTPNITFTISRTNNDRLDFGDLVQV